MRAKLLLRIKSVALAREIQRRIALLSASEEEARAALSPEDFGRWQRARAAGVKVVDLAAIPPTAPEAPGGATRFACCGLGPFGYPASTNQCPQPAVYLVWPKCAPQQTGYGYLCATHLAELRRRAHPIYQIGEITTGRVVFLDGDEIENRRA